MCGRFSFVASGEKIKKQFDIVVREELATSFNIAPTQEAYLISNDNPSQLTRYRWGLIPHWANDEKVGNNLINARSEDIAGKPSFRIPIRQKRCIIIADSFYEWSDKQPYRILSNENQLLAFAGIWDEWKNPQTGEVLRTFALITTASEGAFSQIHNRMPVLLKSKAAYEKWLSSIPLEDVLAFLKPVSSPPIQWYGIGQAINAPKNNTQDVQREVPVIKQSSLFD